MLLRMVVAAATTAAAALAAPTTTRGGDAAAVFSALYRAARRGDAASTSALLTAPASAALINLSHTVGGEGVLVAAVTGWHTDVERYPHPPSGDHSSVLRLLLDAGADASVGCPLMDAVAQRNTPATLALLAAMTPIGAAYCLTAYDTSGQGVFHAAAKSTASGFARLLFRLRSEEEEMGGMLVGGAAPRSESASSLLRHLNFSAPTWSPFGDVSKAAIDAAGGTMFLRALLAAADATVRSPAGGMDLSEALNQRDGAGATPLLLACHHGLHEAVSVLLRWARTRRLRLEGLAPSESSTGCLHAAASGGYTAVLEGAASAMEEATGMGGSARLEFDALLCCARDAGGRTVADVARAHGPTHAAVLRWEEQRCGDAATAPCSDGAAAPVSDDVDVTGAGSEDGVGVGTGAAPSPIITAAALPLPPPPLCVTWGPDELARWASAHTATGWGIAPRASLVALLGEACADAMLLGGGAESSSGRSSSVSGGGAGANSTPTVYSGGGSIGDVLAGGTAHPADTLRVSLASMYGSGSAASALRSRLVADYLSINKPFVLESRGRQGAAASSSSARSSNSHIEPRDISRFAPLRPANLLAAVGGLVVDAGAIPYAASYGMRSSSERTSVKEFVRNHMMKKGAAAVGVGGGKKKGGKGKGKRGGDVVVAMMGVDGASQLGSSTASSDSGSGVPTTQALFDGSPLHPAPLQQQQPQLPQPPYVFDGRIMFSNEAAFAPLLPPTSLFTPPLEEEVRAAAGEHTTAPISSPASVVRPNSDHHLKHTAKAEVHSIDDDDGDGDDGGPVRAGTPPPGTQHHLRQFILGPPLSGSMPHFHGGAVNRLLFGLKLWVLFPPSRAEFGRAHAHVWFARVYPAKYGGMAAGGGSGDDDDGGGSGHLLFLQGPGDVVYVPPHWGHAVINLADSAAVALE